LAESQRAQRGAARRRRVLGPDFFLTDLTSRS
jgi:hypothetical protein